MFDLDNWIEIWATISRNKIRSALTGFGVFWGIFMLIILFGVGNSFKGGMSQIIDGFAPNSSFFYTDLTNEAYKGFRKGRAWTMNNRDIEIIRERTQSIDYISPMIFKWDETNNVMRNDKVGSYTIKGVNPEQFEIEKPKVIKGRLINSLDIEQNRKVCVIGKEVYETLFGINETVIGQYIRVNGIYFQVIGIITSTSNISIGASTESLVILPFTTMQRTYNEGDAIQFLACTSKPGYSAKNVEYEVKNILKSEHNISPTDEKAIGNFNAEMVFKIFEAVFIGVDALALFVGAGSLLSGIIGICNIMLVTVKERTREIGIRRALGAKPSIIVKQILAESLALTAIAGLIGFIFGVIFLEIIRYLMESGALEVKLFVPPFVSFSIAIKAMIILIISGVIGGVLPAMRALNIKAIDAIREE